MTSDYRLDQGREGKRLPKAVLTPSQPPAAVTFTRSELCPLPGASLSRCQLRRGAPGAVQPDGRQCCSEIRGLFTGLGKGCMAGLVVSTLQSLTGLPALTGLVLKIIMQSTGRLPICTGPWTRVS